jgi:hypothetical protein
MKTVKWKLAILTILMGCLGWVASLPAAPPAPAASESKNLGEAKDLLQKLPLPDLAIEYVTITPQNPTLGGNLTIQFAIKNIGQAVAAPAHAALAAMELYQPLNISTGGVNTQTLSPGQSQVFTYSGVLNAQQFNITTGMHTFGIDLNLARDPQESNYQNNFSMVQFYIYPQGGGPPAQLPDLTVSSLTISPAIPQKGSSASVSLTVANNGPGPAAGSKAFFTGSSTVLQALGLPLLPNTFDVPALNPGQTFSKNFASQNVNLDPGEYEFFALVNTSMGSFPEANTSNNKLKLKFKVIGSIAPIKLDKTYQKVPGPIPPDPGPLQTPRVQPQPRQAPAVK